MLELLVSLKWPLVILQIGMAPILIILILIQSGKGDDLGSAFGGGQGGGVQGTGGASKVVVKATVVFAILFMVNNIALAKIFKEVSSSSVGTSVAEPIAPAAPAAPLTPAVPAPAPAAPTPAK